MLSFSYMHVLSILVTYSKNGLEKSTLEFSIWNEFSCQLRNLGIHILWRKDQVYDRPFNFLHSKLPIYTAKKHNFFTAFFKFLLHVPRSKTFSFFFSLFLQRGI